MTDRTLEANIELTDLTNKVDRLTALLEAQEKRNQLLQSAEVLSVFERLSTNADQLHIVLDNVEAMADLQSEVDGLAPQMMRFATRQLTSMQEAGYFGLFNQFGYVVRQIATEFDEDDVKALGDNIVTILKTVRNMTQPEIMTLANNAVDAMRTEDEPLPEKVSTLALMKEMNDPQVKQGLVKLLHMVKAMADVPANPSNN